MAAYFDYLTSDEKTLLWTFFVALDRKAGERWAKKRALERQPNYPYRELPDVATDWLTNNAIKISTLAPYASAINNDIQTAVTRRLNALNATPGERTEMIFYLLQRFPFPLCLNP